MRSSLAVSAILAVTVATLALLLATDPVRALHDYIATGTSTGREDAVVLSVYRDSHTQETSVGEHPLPSLRLLERDWCDSATSHRFVLAGNSQTMSVVLAPSEQPAAGTEPTYPDLLLAELRSTDTSVLGYRLAAPNLSYVELLWNVEYLLTRPCLTPDQLVVQLNFESFRKSGIRDGMLELLDDASFATAIESEAMRDSPYVAVLQQALERYRARRAQLTGDSGSIARQGSTGVIESRGLGGQVETVFRDVLEQFEPFRARTQMKAEFEQTLYLLRANVLGITPTTRRSLGGAALMVSVSALERVGVLCRQHGTRLTLFNAPQNPRAPLYRTERDRQEYNQIILNLSHKYATSYFDFEDTIPADMWGVWIDGPDPIHFGRAGHRRLADTMFRAGLIARP